MTTLKFMGEEFENVERLTKAYPAFAGADALRAIRAGCTTVMEVETYCWRHKQGWMKRVRAGAKEVSRQASLRRYPTGAKGRRKAA